MIIICPRGSDSQASKNNGENNENVPRVCVNYCISETEHGIKTAKASIRHSAMIACWQRALFVLYYFLLLSQMLPSNIEIYWIYRQSKTRVQYGRCLHSRTATEPAFIKLRRLNRLTFFAKWNFDLWIVISSILWPVCVACASFRGRKRLFRQETLWRTADTFFGSNIVFVLSCRRGQSRVMMNLNAFENLAVIKLTRVLSTIPKPS